MAVAVVLLALAAGTLYTIDPARYIVTPPCPYRTLLGLACPGCGLTRATHAALHGDWGRAFALNPWSFVAAPAALVFTVLSRLPEHARARHARSGVAWAMLVITLAFWVWRNTDAYPFIRL